MVKLVVLFTLQREAFLSLDSSCTCKVLATFDILLNLGKEAIVSNFILDKITLMGDVEGIQVWLHTHPFQSSVRC